MGQSCGVKNLFYIFTFLQVISTFERQIFDFLGFMWVPILANFLHSIFVILGIFGAYQYRLNYLISYLIWNLIWSAWNAFIVCFYLHIGKLNPEDDLLSFGTGSFSWWVANGFGCNPEYFPDNSTLELDESKLYLPVRPTKVTGCLIQYQYVEVTHACIQLLFAAFGFALGVYLAHYLVAVVIPRRRKSSSGNSAMYSIEYSPQVNETILNRDDPCRVQEIDMYSETRTANHGSSAVQMTPRRVKRRSHTRNSTRSAGKIQSNKQPRSSTRSTRSLGRAGGSRALNPVTRLMEREDRARNPIMDSSTSNDGTERYGVTQPPPIGMVNHAFESSRPNSLYSALPGGSSVVSNQQSSITDCETISRPPSALTSYSNFHGQRRPAIGGSGPNQNGNRADNFTSLTQESLTSHHQIRPFGASGGPISSNFHGTQLTQESLNHVNTNKLANGHSNFSHQNGFGNATTAAATSQQQHHQNQMNGYTNNTSYDDLPPPPPPLSSSPTDEIVSRADNDSDSAQDSSISKPVPQQRSNPRRNEYVNMPVQQQQPQQQQQHHRTDDWNDKGFRGDNRSVSSTASNPPPLPPMRPHNYANMAGFSYLPDPSSEQQQSGRHFQLGSRSSRFTDNSSADESISIGGHQNVNYNDMMTLKLDARLNYHPQEDDQPSLQQQQQQPLSLPPLQPNPHRQQNGHSSHTNGSKEPTSMAHNAHRQITLDYGSMFETSNDKASVDATDDLQRATRVPTGHQRRDRASLRAKHKQDMEKQQKQQKMSVRYDCY